jgi:hypothetical protein
MSLTKGVYRVAESKSKAKGLVKNALYIVISGLIAYYLKGSINDFAEYWNLPLQGDLLVTMIAIAIGMLFTTMMLYFYEKSIKKNERRILG